MICSNCQRDIADYSRFCYFCGKRQVSAPVGGAVRQLHRSIVDSKIAGVCGGMAEYFETDSTIVRLVWVLVTLVTGIIPGIVVYLVAWLIMPEMPVVVPAAPNQNVTEAPRA
ncbi:MAG TPA: PspC domain-containing protein [Candidatus Acidoferrales bacterium]|nr:PspC domain-containing protein [Candidatus Acidoferrales bacterium]